MDNSIRYIKAIQILLLLTGSVVFSQASSRSVLNDGGFSLVFQRDYIQIESHNLKLTTVLPSAGKIYTTDQNRAWALQNTSTHPLTLAGEEGILQNDIFSNGEVQIERKTWISVNKELTAFQQTFTNISKKEVQLNALYPLNLNNKENNQLFNGSSGYRVLTQKTLKNGRPGVVFSREGIKIDSDPFIIINDSLKNDNLFIGAQSYYHHLFALELEFAGDGTQLKTLKSRCNFEGVTVQSGRTRESQWVVISQGIEPYELITAYAERMKRHHNYTMLSETPPSVFCTWYYHADNYNEELFNHDIATFKKEPLPFDVFLIDECWQVNAWGDFEANQFFPSGMKKAAGQIRSVGYIPGIWTPPYLIDPGTNLEKNHPEWLLRNSKGELCTFFMNKSNHYILDPTSPGVTEYLEKSYRKLSQEWGYKYYKFDFMRAVFVDSDQQFHDPGVTSLEAYRLGLEAIRRGVGNDSYISVCGGHYGASLDLAESQRSGSDVKSIWCESEIPKYRQNILRTWMAAFWHVDPDAMMVRRQKDALPDDRRELTVGLFSDKEAQTNALNQFVGGGLISFTEDFSTIDADRKSLYHHVIPSVNKPSQPLDIWDPVCPNLMLTPIAPRCKNLPEWNMLSVVNWSDGPKDYAIELKDRVIPSNKEERFLVFEFFSQKVLGIFTKNQTIYLKNISPHESRLLKIIPWSGKIPVLAGTNKSFSNGTEIVKWEITKNNIKGEVDTPWDEPVNITIAIPDNSEKGFRTETIRIKKGKKLFKQKLK